MQVTVFYTGTSLLAPLRDAERTINRDYKLDLRVAAYNFGSPLDEKTWDDVELDLHEANVVFVIHVMDGENASRLLASLQRHEAHHRAVAVINCMPELMRRTRMGKLDAGRLFKAGHGDGEKGRRGERETGGRGEKRKNRALSLFNAAGSWIGRQVHAGSNGNHTRSNGKSPTENNKSTRANRRRSKARGHGQYLTLIDKLPHLLRFVPGAGILRDIKNYLNLFCYFLQPTPANIRAMILYCLKEYAPAPPLSKIRIPPPERMPSVAIYHPDSPKLFESFDAYQKWYLKQRPKTKGQRPKINDLSLNPDSTIGLLLMRPQVVSKTTQHYDALIRAIEDEGLSVIPAISTLMDNREACQKFFVDEAIHEKSKVQSSRSNAPKTKSQISDFKAQTPDYGQLTNNQSRVSQIFSLTGFSFVGGPAMNDSRAASEFLRTLNRPYRSAVSLDTQSIEAWRDSLTGLNPVQAGMQVAIPEIDGATEPFIYGGIPAMGVEPVALEDRCQRLARRLRRANRLKTSSRKELKLALVLFCFPPNKGNIGTAADLDVFPSVWEALQKLKADGYDVELPDSADDLRSRLLAGNSEKFGVTANVAYRMNVEEYRRLCPYVDEIEQEWGQAPGRINALGDQLLIQGITIGKVFIGVQPTFGYEGDPMRLMMARSGAPHHGFMAFYTYLSRVLDVDAVIHVGTHGSLEFMPGKQVGMSGDCWPDRLIGELPNFYIYSVNNPSEGSIAKRRSYAELISYLTPPLENAGLYKALAELKDLLNAYRQAATEEERQNLFETIEKISLESSMLRRTDQMSRGGGTFQHRQM